MRQEAIRKLKVDCFARKHRDFFDSLQASPKYLGRAR